MTTEPSPAGTPETRPARWRRLAGGRRLLAPLILGVLGAVAGVLAFTATRPEPPAPLTRKDVQSVAATVVAKAAEAPPRTIGVYRSILPSLVFIRTEGSEARPESRGLGSGVIVNDDGAILTAHHVVEGARKITVTFADGTESPAEVLQTFPNDLAVLRAERGPELIVPAVLAGGARIGDETYAVGNPLGLTASFSAGVISGLERTIPIRRGERTLSGLIQFDAAVNPGSSGGPLLNRNGHVIGIVTALANPSNDTSFTGIGFAVPLSAGGGGVGGPPR